MFFTSLNTVIDDNEGNIIVIELKGKYRNKFQEALCETETSNL